MQKTDFSELQRIQFYTKNIVTDFQCWNRLNSWCTPDSGRINNGIMLVLAKKATYKLHSGEIICAYPGDVLLLPKGAVYSCTFEDGEDIIDLSFRGINRSCLFLGFDLFDGDFSEIIFSGKPRIILHDRSAELVRSFERLCKMRYRSEYIGAMLCAETSLFLLSLCARINSEKDKNGGDDLLSHLTDYIYDNSDTVSVSELVEMSGVSASSLRRKFISGLGMTPVNYINSVKIENAKSYFESGITKIKDVSRLCGIDDEFYFSRLFSKVVGMSPTAYLKKIKNINK